MELFDLKDSLDRAGILISFNGPFSHSIIEELGNAVKKYLAGENIQKGTLMDVFSVYIEATQNVRNYTLLKGGAGADPRLINSGIIVIAKRGEHYEVRAGNLVETGDAAGLVGRLDQLAGLDKAALKALYREQLRKEVPPGSPGAGLGLIDMARKAAAPLHHSLTPVDDRYAFFSLCVTL